MYTNGNLEAHIAAMLFLATAGLAFLLLGSATVLFFVRRNWARQALIGCAALVAGYAAVLAGFSVASYERTLARGEEKHFCELDCHIAYSVQDVERVPTIGDVTAKGEFYIVRLRTLFDPTTISPRRPKDAPLTPVPPDVMLVDDSGRAYGVSITGQNAWDTIHGPQPSAREPLVPGASYDRILVFDGTRGEKSPRLLLTLVGPPSPILVGDESSPGHKKTYLSL